MLVRNGDILPDVVFDSVLNHIEGQPERMLIRLTRARIEGVCPVQNRVRIRAVRAGSETSLNRRRLGVRI